MTITDIATEDTAEAAEITGDCTCCDPPRPSTFDHACQEWVHDDDETGADMFHVHEDTSGRDCDGRLDTSQVCQITSIRWRPDELGQTFNQATGEWVPTGPTPRDLWVKLVRLAMPTGEGEARIEPVDDNGHLRMTWSEPTDEGWNGGQLTGCDDPTCAHERSSQRDHFAEAMGF